MRLLHDNAPSHKSNPVIELIHALGKALPHAAYSPDLAPSDFHLYASMGHALSEQLFTSYEDDGFIIGSPQRRNSFFGKESTNCPRDGRNAKLTMDSSLNKMFCTIVQT